MMSMVRTIQFFREKTHIMPWDPWSHASLHRENGGTLGMVPLTINPIYTLYSGYLDVFIG